MAYIAKTKNIVSAKRAQTLKRGIAKALFAKGFNPTTKQFNNGVSIEETFTSIVVYPSNMEGAQGQTLVRFNGTKENAYQADAISILDLLDGIAMPDDFEKVEKALSEAMCDTEVPCDIPPITIRFLAKDGNVDVERKVVRNSTAVIVGSYSGVGKETASEPVAEPTNK